jgi:hypothetical protein
MIGIVLEKYSESPTIYGTIDPCELFRSCSLKCLRSLVLNCSSSKAEIPPRRNIKIYLFKKFSYSKILE